MTVTDDEAALLRRARQGDEAAFSVLFERHQRAVYRYAVYMCGIDAADDIVQETFMAVLKQSRREDFPASTVRAYLLGVARHRVLKRISLKDWPEPLEDADAAALHPASSTDRSPLEELTRAEVVAGVRHAIQSLPAAYREVLLLCELHELDYVETARLLGCPVGTVRSRAHRAKALLAAKLSASHWFVRS